MKPKYKKLIGSLLNLSNIESFDTTFIVSNISLYWTSPQKPH